MLSIDRELKSLVEKLNALHIPYALCGGLAVAVHGYPRATLDIDLLALRGSSSHIEKTARDLGYTLRAGPMQFASGKITIVRISKTNPDDEDIVPLDILTLESSLESSIRCQEAEWDGLTLQVISRKSLIMLKQLRNNHQDQADIEKLES